MRRGPTGLSQDTAGIPAVAEEDAGLIPVVRGSAAGLDLTRVQEITQETAGVDDLAFFGRALG